MGQQIRTESKDSSVKSGGLQNRTTVFNIFRRRCYFEDRKEADSLRLCADDASMSA